MDRIKVDDCVRLKHISKRRGDDTVNPVGIVESIDGAYFYVNVEHYDAVKPVPYECYENELEKVSSNEYFRCLLAGYNDLPNSKNEKIKI